MLKDLRELTNNINKKFSTLELIDKKLPIPFVQAYSNLLTNKTPHGYSSIIWNQNTAIVETTSGRKIYLPNQWFYIAASFIEYYLLLMEYKKFFLEIFKSEINLKDVADELKKNQNDKSFKKYLSAIDKYFSNQDEKELFIKFVTDYKWWGGGKTIDRGDFYVSPLMMLGNLLAETQTAIAEITEQLATYPELKGLINIDNYYITQPNSSSFKEEIFFNDIKNSGFYFKGQLIISFISSLLTKPFVILTGLSGSGKTKLAQAFAEWICGDEAQFCLIPVGADWTSREPLLGYPNALEPGRYVKPDNGVVDLLIEASKTENSDKPYFLILDEMNLSHVERYFADFLSIMEAGKDSKISLHPDTPDWKNNGSWKDGVPDKISLPSNLFIIGTVNIDETTYMFSPKVLDRANVIEFRVTEKEIDEFLKNPVKPDLDNIKGAGAGMAADFVKIAKEKILDFNDQEVIKETLVEFFRELKKTGSEFGYRSSSEIFRFAGILRNLTEAEGKAWETDDIIDAAILQKLLPKLHGSKKKLEKVLEALGRLCLKKDTAEPDEFWKKLIADPDIIDDSEDVRFKRSLEKILRMKRRADQDGFTSFAEA